MHVFDVATLRVVMVLLAKELDGGVRQEHCRKAITHPTYLT
jgi:hypothetical protein